MNSPNININISYDFIPRDLIIPNINISFEDMISMICRQWRNTWFNNDHIYVITCYVNTKNRTYHPSILASPPSHFLFFDLQSSRLYSSILSLLAILFSFSLSYNIFSFSFSLLLPLLLTSIDFFIHTFCFLIISSCFYLYFHLYSYLYIFSLLDYTSYLLFLYSTSYFSLLAFHLLLPLCDS